MLYFILHKNDSKLKDIKMKSLPVQLINMKWAGRICYDCLSEHSIYCNEDYFLKIGLSKA